MVVDIAAGYIANALLQNLVIPEIAKRLAGKAGEKGAKLKDIEKPEWLRKIGLWLDDHNVSKPEAAEEILRELTEHKGELSDPGKRIFDAVNELKKRIEDSRLTNEDKEFLREIKKSFDLDEFEKRLEKILQKNAVLDSQRLHKELTTFFAKMDWDDKFDDIAKGIEDIRRKLIELAKSKGIKITYLPETPPDVSEFVDRETHLNDLGNSLTNLNSV